jgi:hypothetical protein
MPEVPVSDEVQVVDAGADVNEEASEEGGESVMEETKMGGRKHKKSNQFDNTFVTRLADLFKYYNAYGDSNVHRKDVTTDGHHVGNWARDQRKKYKSGTFSDSRINIITPLNFEITKQRNGVGNKYTVPVAIAKIFK